MLRNFYLTQMRQNLFAGYFLADAGECLPLYAEITAKVRK
jgi:hypothetical protein